VWRKIRVPIFKACEEERQARLAREAAAAEAERIRNEQRQKELEALLELKRLEERKTAAMHEWVAGVQNDMEQDEEVGHGESRARLAI
jgi:hypothetical protein